MGRLREYLENTRRKGESAYQRFDRFGKQLGVSGSCVRKWLYKQRSISDTMQKKIVELTHGNVAYKDMRRLNLDVQEWQYHP